MLKMNFTSFRCLHRYNTMPTNRNIEEESRITKPPVPTPDKIRQDQSRIEVESTPPPRPAPPTEAKGDISMRSYHDQGTPSSRDKPYMYQTTTTETVTKHFKMDEPELQKSELVSFY